jgi:F0F1-type ATP synthase assembly protein I
MPGRQQGPSLWRYSGIGFELIGAVGALSLFGYWIDRHYGTTPWGLIIGAVTGIIGGLWNLIREALMMSREMEAHRRDDEPGDRK